MQAIRARVKYVCDFLFAGNLSRFSTALGVNYGHLRKALYDRGQVTSKMLAQIVSRTHVRAEWLLTGSGPMMVDVENRVESGFQLPFTLQSVFPVFDAGLLPGTPIAKKKARRPRKRSSDSVLDAAQEIHACRVFGRPVCFFLGADAFAEKRPRLVAQEFVRGTYATSVAVTGGCLPYELAADFDVNFAARSAALHGIGLGEALCRWGDLRKRGVFARVCNSHVPITVHAELGEVAFHLQPTLRGAEMGAAWGAAAYVDHLVFAEQLREFSAHRGGVCVILGEPARWLRLIDATLTALSAAISDNSFGDFAVIQLGESAHDTQEKVKSHGGHFYHMKGTYGAAAQKLLRACVDVFDGKITHDYR